MIYVGNGSLLPVSSLCLLIILPIGPLCSPRQFHLYFHVMCTLMVLHDHVKPRTVNKRKYIYLSETGLIHLI